MYRYYFTVHFSLAGLFSLIISGLFAYKAIGSLIEGKEASKETIFLIVAGVFLVVGINDIFVAIKIKGKK